MAVVSVRLHPLPPFPIKAELFVAPPPCSATRLPHTHGRPLGFAPPPHDGFALLAAAHGCACLATNASYTAPPHHATLLGHFSAYRRCIRVALRYTLSLLMPALLAEGDEFLMNSWRNFLERNHVKA